jgi:hypothetical protein
MKHQMYQGQLISAGLNLESDEISITSIKHIPTLSVWEMDQAKRMQRSLSEAIHNQDEQFVVTVRDSIPILLQKDEMQQLHKELNEMIELLIETH